MNTTDNLIFIIALTIILYLLRATIPFLKYPFLLVFIGQIIFLAIKYKIWINTGFKDFVKNFYLVILLTILLCISFFISNKLYLIVFKDVVNTLILLCIFLLMKIYITNIKDLKIFLEKLVNMIIVFALLISFRLLLSHVINLFSKEITDSSVETSLIGSMSADYNFALLPIVLGMFSVLYILIKQEYFHRHGILTLILIVFSTTIVLSGSRRGIITLAGIFIIILITYVISCFTKGTILVLIKEKTRSFFLYSLILTFIPFGFIFLPVQIKKPILAALSISISSYKDQTSILLYKYSSIFSKREYTYFRRIIWKEKFDSANPKSGWGSHISSSVYPLTGKNVEIVPKNVIGYKMDSTCDASTWSDNAYSYTDISGLFRGKDKIETDEYYYSSVYCFVSDDFDGSWAYIFSENAIGKNVHPYDFKKKGVWQKLEIFFKTTGDIPPVYLYWGKAGCTDFSNVNGYIIFAYPEYKKICPDSNDPVIWGTRTSTTVYPLYGENVEIVPENAFGYKMDSTCNVSNWGGSAYSFTDISILFKNGSQIESIDSLEASVYCFVSKNFNASWAQISAEGNASGITVNQYDFDKKGTWQKLQIKFITNKGLPPVYLYWAMAGVTDFSKLRGYLIFAYPEYKKSNYIKKSEEISSTYDLNTEKRLNKKPTKYSMSKNSFNQIKYNRLSTNPFLLINLFLFSKTDSTLKAVDPIRNLASKFISEDTIYYGFKNQLLIDTSNNNFFGGRFMRWQFAKQIFVEEYNIKQKIFGGGFNFLNWFGYRFQNDKMVSDYPHNPFLSVLLYSGILGLIIYILFILKVFYYYIRFLKEYYLFSIFFLITFFFSFFSAGSPFDPPIMGFFVILPFFLNYIHKKEIESK